MTRPRPSRTAWIMWLAAAAFWIFVGLLYVGQVWWITRQPGGQRFVLGRATWVWQGAFYLSWIPLTVLIWRVAARWDLAGLGWPRLVARHVLLVLAVCFAQAVTVTAIGMKFGGPERESFMAAALGQLRGRGYQLAVIYLAVAMTGHTMVLYERWRRRELDAAQLEAQLSEARLESLRAQLHPHFLFNSLHTIASLVRDERNADAVRLISALGDLLRRVLESRSTDVAVSDEVDLLRRYVEIQAARFGDRLRVSIDVDPRVASARVPALLIQPLVDNAIQHGLSSRPEGGSVAVTIAPDADQLIVRVEDTGSGAPPGWSIDASSGTGLRNLRSRLGVLFGSRATLTAGPQPGGGFLVTATLPLERS